MSSGFRFEIAACCAALALSSSLASNALACPAVSPDEKRTLSYEVVPGFVRDLQIRFFESEAPRGGECFASLEIPLSIFPAANVRIGPNDVARVVRETAEEWGARQCTIWVRYENDTRANFAPYELCRRGQFTFGASGVRSVDEAFCWTPELP
jgi:hypothetical protein